MRDSTQHAPTLLKREGQGRDPLRSARRRLLSLVTAVGLLLGTYGAATAEEICSTATAVEDGTLAVSSASISFGTTTLSGVDQTMTAALNSWFAVDARGNGNGWNVTVQSTSFTTTAPVKTIDITQADQEFKIKILDADIVADPGSGTKPTSSVTSLTAIPSSSALKIISAAVGDGMGSYTFTPSFELEVPAEAFAGAYSATIVVTAVDAP